MGRTMGPGVVTCLVLCMLGSRVHATVLYAQKLTDVELKPHIPAEVQVIQCQWSFTFQGEAVSLSYLGGQNDNVTIFVVATDKQLVYQNFDFLKNEYGLILKNVSSSFSTKYNFQCLSTPETVLNNITEVMVISYPGPASIVYNSSDVIDGRQVTFACQSEGGYPSVAVEWTLGGAPLVAQSPPVTDSSLVTLSEVRTLVTKQDGGQALQCRAYLDIPGLESSSQQTKAVILDVLYKPEVSFDVSYNPYIIVDMDGPPSTLTCLSDANPGNGLSTQWFFDGVHHSSQDGRTSVDITHLGEREIGCQVTNSVGMGSTSTTVIVQSTPTVEIDKRHHVLSEGSEEGLVIACTAEGFPAPMIHWTNSADEIVSPPAHVSSNLSFGGPIQRSIGGNYTCVVNVELTPSGIEPSNQTIYKDVSIDIQYKPGPVVVTGLSDTEYVSGSVLTIHCSLPVTNQGNPKGEVTWYKGGESLSSGGTLTIANLQPQHMGDYQCFASNTLGAGPPTVASVLVKGKPTILRPYKVAVSQGTAVNVSCRVLSSTAVRFGWRRSGQSIPFKETSTLSPYEHVSYVEVARVGSGDYGEYECSAQNELGPSTHTLKLVTYGAPEAPLNLRSKSVTWQAVVLRWDPGFDGGMAATYSISVRKDGKEVTGPMGNISEIADVTVQVQGLLPRSEYSFTVRASNALGQGVVSEPLLVSTLSLSFPFMKMRLQRDNHTATLQCPECGAHFQGTVSGRMSNGAYVNVQTGVVFRGAEEIILDLGENMFDYYQPSVCYYNRSDVCQLFSEAGQPKPSTDGGPPMTLLIVVGTLAGVCFLAMVCVVAVILWKKRNPKAEVLASPSIGSPDNQRHTILQTDTGDRDYSSRGALSAAIKANGNGYKPYLDKSKTAYRADGGGDSYAYCSVNKGASQMSSSGEPSPPLVPDEGHNNVHINQVYEPAGMGLHNASSRRRLASDYDDPDALPPYSSRQDSISVASSKSPFVIETESGYSTPQKKPKKIIYEVIV